MTFRTFVRSGKLHVYLQACQDILRYLLTHAHGNAAKVRTQCTFSCRGRRVNVLTVEQVGGGRILVKYAADSGPCRWRSAATAAVARDGGGRRVDDAD